MYKCVSAMQVQVGLIPHTFDLIPYIHLMLDASGCVSAMKVRTLYLKLSRVCVCNPGSSWRCMYSGGRKRATARRYASV